MIQTQRNSPEETRRQAGRAGGEFHWNLLDFLHFLVRWKRLLFWNTFLWSTAAVIAVLFILPEKFLGRTVLMPPEDRAEGITKMMRNVPLTKLGGGGAGLLSGLHGKDLENIYLAILNSRSLRMEVIRQFDLVRVYEFDKKGRYYIEDVLKKLDKNTTIEITDEGTFIISVKDESRQRAAEMANFMAATLNSIYQRLTSETQRNQRIFLGERLELVKADLNAAENAYVAFQKRNKMLDIDEQARVTIDAGSELEARYLAAELKLDITRKVFTQENPKVKELEMELRELKRQRESFSNQRRSDLLIPYNMAPDLGLELVRLKRDLKVQETLFELILQQYEFAKFEESKSTPSVQILDRAEPPQKRAAPKRARTCVAAFLASLLAGCLAAAIIEWYRRFRDSNPDEFSKLRSLKEAVFSWKFLLP